MKINGYRILNYIQSSGSQWINANYNFNNSTNAKIQSKYLALSSSYLFSNSNGYTSHYDNYSGHESQLIINNVFFDVLSTSNDYNELTFELANGVGVETLNGNTSTKSVANMNNGEFYLLSNYNHTELFSAKLYNFKIWDNNTLVRNFIPCERESDNTLGLYDLVNNVFYTNSGSGTFISGGYALETEANPQNSGTFTDVCEYQVLDYIQSSGTQYINTLLNFKSGLKFDFKFRYLSSVFVNETILFGANSSSNEVMFGYSNRSINYLGGQFNYTWIVNTDYTIILDLANTSNNLILNVNDSEVRNVSGGVNTNPIMLFGGYGSGYYPFAERYYYCKIYDGNTLVRDYIPVIRLSDNAIGLLDKVNNVFYGNSGSGTFTYGQVLGTYHKVTAIPNSNYEFVDWTLDGYTQLDYIESSGTQYINTGYYVRHSNKYSLDVTHITNNGVGSFLCGGVYQQSLHSIGVNSSNAFYIFNPPTNQNHTTLITLNNGQRYSIDCDWNNNLLTITSNGTPTTLAISNNNIDNNTKPLMLFSEEGIINFIKTKLHSCKIYDNGTLVRDFIPCIRHKDGQIGLLDKVHMKFYGNSGSGVFVEGSVV